MTQTAEEWRVFAPGFELRDVEDEGELLTRIHGRAVPYNTPADIGPFTEEIRRGAFASSIGAPASGSTRTVWRQKQGHGLPLTLFHRDTELDQHIGVADTWEDRADGLYGTWRLDRSPNAQEAGRMAKDGILNFFSIRFQSAGEGETEIVQRRGVKPHMIRHRGRLIATSLLSTPAYAGAGVSWVRTHDDGAVRRAQRDELRSWLDWADKHDVDLSGLRAALPTR